MYKMYLNQAFMLFDYFIGVNQLIFKISPCNIICTPGCLTS